MADDRTDPQYKLRMPADLKERIEEAARAHKRSMNAEIVARLESSFGDDPFAPSENEFERYAGRIARQAAEDAVQNVFRFFISNYTEAPIGADEMHLLNRVAAFGLSRGAAEGLSSEELRRLDRIRYLIDLSMAGGLVVEPTNNNKNNAIRTDYIIETRDEKNQKSQRKIVEIKSSLAQLGAAKQQVKKYLSENPEYDSGIVLVTDGKDAPSIYEIKRDDKLDGQEPSTKTAELKKRLMDLS